MQTHDPLPPGRENDLNPFADPVSLILNLYIWSQRIGLYLCLGLIALAVVGVALYVAIALLSNPLATPLLAAIIGAAWLLWSRLERSILRGRPQPPWLSP